jgi:hypothetical protein
MARPARPWFRFYVEAFGDRKIRRLSPAHRWLWVAILGAARESPEPGVLLVAEDLPMTFQELADYAGMPLREVTKALPQMLKLGMIALSDDTISVPKFNSRQFESDNVTARTREHRERSKEQDGNVPKNVRGNTPETETETETEEKQGGKPPATTKKATQLPADFTPNDSNRRIAAERGLDLRACFEQFADHHRARGSTFKDWNLAFNTWLRRERAGVPQLTIVTRDDGSVDPASLPPVEQSWMKRRPR